MNCDASAITEIFDATLTNCKLKPDFTPSIGEVEVSNTAKAVIDNESEAPGYAAADTLYPCSFGLSC